MIASLLVFACDVSTCLSVQSKAGPPKTTFACMRCWRHSELLRTPPREPAARMHGAGCDRRVGVCRAGTSSQRSLSAASSASHSSRPATSSAQAGSASRSSSASRRTADTTASRTTAPPARPGRKSARRTWPPPTSLTPTSSSEASSGPPRSAPPRFLSYSASCRAPNPVLGSVPAPGIRSP